jgi:hypothetical protein
METYHAVELVERFYFGCKSSSKFGFGANPLMIVRFTQEWELVVGDVNYANCRGYMLVILALISAMFIGYNVQNVRFSHASSLSSVGGPR